MTKSDLKTGMIVVNEISEYLMVFKDVYTKEAGGDFLVQMDTEGMDAEGWDELDSYDENLMNTSPCCQHLNIVKVLTFKHPSSFFVKFDLNNMNVIWER